MKNLLTLALVLMAFIPNLLAQFSDDFEGYSCDENEAAMDCYAFNRFFLSPLSPGCSWRSEQLGDPSTPAEMTTPALNFSGPTDIEIDYQVTSGFPSFQFPTIEVFAINAITLSETSLAGPTNMTTSLETLTVSTNLNGLYRIKFVTTAAVSGTSSRALLDNLEVLTNATLAEVNSGGGCVLLIADPIPTMGEWALFLFGMSIFTLGLVVVYNVNRNKVKA